MAGVKGGHLPRGEAALNKLLAYYKRNARARNLDWDLTRDEFREIIRKPCYYCGEPPSRTYDGGGTFYGSVTYNGIDRLNNFMGYHPENVVPSCYTCNRAKGPMDPDAFLAWVGKVHEKHIRELG